MNFLFEEPIEGFTPGLGVGDDPLAFVFVGDELVVRHGSEEPLTLATIAAAGIAIDDVSAVGTLDGRSCVTALASAPLPEGFAAKPVRKLFGRLDVRALAVGAYASQISHFLKTHRFCGECGGPMTRSLTERCVRCAVCQRDVYPRVAPCVIVLVHDGTRILLTRGAHFPQGMYGLVAGFVEPGESLEVCARREILEETGVRITDLEYVASQPWPFPSQLMVGYAARYAGGELVVDRNELEDAQWFELDALPQIPPPLSIARHLIERHRARKPRT